jgi:hypothetical protein
MKLKKIDHSETLNSTVKAAIETAKERGINIIVVDEHPNAEEQAIRRINRNSQRTPVITYVDDSIMVNGVRYIPTEPKHKNISRSAAMLVNMSAALGTDILGSVDKMFRQLPKDVDIIKEYGLIELKKSRLSSWERNAVVRTFERNFKKVETNEQ